MFIYKYMVKKQLKKYIKQIANKDKRVSGNHGKNRKDDKSIELTNPPPKLRNTAQMIQSFLFVGIKGILSINY